MASCYALFCFDCLNVFLSIWSSIVLLSVNPILVLQFNYLVFILVIFLSCFFLPLISFLFYFLLLSLFNFIFFSFLQIYLINWWSRLRIWKYVCILELKSVSIVFKLQIKIRLAQFARKIINMQFRIRKNANNFLNKCDKYHIFHIHLLISS